MTATDCNMNHSDQMPPKRREGELRPRLCCALTLLGRVRVLADIGCDHGKFSAQALRLGLCQRVIASDVSAPSLDKARALASSLGLEDRFTFRCCGGFDGYSGLDADAAALLGMGGELIAAILEGGKAVAQGLERIVMQPMRGEAELREYLYKSGYRILDEAVCLDAGRYYQLIAAKYDPERAGPPPSFMPEGWYQFGAAPIQRRDPTQFAMMERYLGIMEKKLERSSSAGEPPRALVCEIENTRRLIDYFLNERQ